jgi:hypothetical protein
MRLIRNAIACIRRPSPCHAVLIRTAECRNHFSVCVQVAVDLSSMSQMPPGRDFFVWAVMAEAKVDNFGRTPASRTRSKNGSSCVGGWSPEISLCRRMRPARAGRIPANSKTIPLRFPVRVAHYRSNRGLLNAPSRYGPPANRNPSPSPYPSYIRPEAPERIRPPVNLPVRWTW